MNAVEENAIEDRVAEVEAQVGPIEVVVFNLGAQIGDRALADTSVQAVRDSAGGMATFALFRVRDLRSFPLMEERGQGHASS